MHIWVDADACPGVIKEILYRVAERTRLPLTLVANQWLKTPPYPSIRSIQVPKGFDVADTHIVEQVQADDLVITADIPLAAAVIDKGALALNPRTLILDEITNGQDAIEKERMMQYLQTLNEEKGITIVLISHDMDVVRRYAKRAIVLKDGDLVYDGTPTELFGGAYAVEEWGLRRPTAAALAGSLGFTAATPEEFCRLLVRKGAED